jgi:hypothetical protein
VGLLCGRRCRHGFLPAAAADRFPLRAAIPMICRGRALLDLLQRSCVTGSELVLSACRARSWPACVPGHGGLLLCARPWHPVAGRGCPLAACCRCVPAAVR